MDIERIDPVDGGDGKLKFRVVFDTHESAVVTAAELMSVTRCQRAVLERLGKMFDPKLNNNEWRIYVVKYLLDKAKDRRDSDRQTATSESD